MNRIDFLREATINGESHSKRIPFKDPETISQSGGTLYERRAKAVAWLLDNSPVHIYDRELIVGTKTILRANKGNEDGYDVIEYSSGAMPAYINEDDVKWFGFKEQDVNKTHYTPDYGIVLSKGIGGLLESAKKRLDEVLKDIATLEKQYPLVKNVKSCFEAQGEINLDIEILYKARALRNSVEFLNAVIISWNAASRFIKRYAQHAIMLAKTEKDNLRAKELDKIAEVCQNISINKPNNFYEAVQLFWFAHLCIIIESHGYINYGRVDQLLYPFLGDMPKEQAQELIECLLVKMHDQAGLKCSYLGRYGGQLTMTLGGLDEQGKDAVNDVTYMLIEGAGKTRLTEPLIAFRINSLNPALYTEKLCALSESGLNTIAMYNDDLFIDSLKNRDIPEKYANTYGFGLCQDITVPGYDDNSFWTIFSPISHWFGFFNNNLNVETFEEFYDEFKKMCEIVIDINLDQVYSTEEAFVKFRQGNCEHFFEKLKKSEITQNLNYRSLMTPHPLLSGLYHGCIETGADITLGACPIKTHGHYLFFATVSVNSLIAMKYVVFDKQLCTMHELKKVLDENFSGEFGQRIRQALLNAPKWGNDDEYADSIAVDFLEHCLKAVQKHSTYEGGKWLSGIHTPHTVDYGKKFGATPDGRASFEPFSVSMTPSTGTMKNGPLAALKSSAKFNHLYINWNYCFMLNLSISLFKQGEHLMQNMLTSYFKIGGMQLQPNICNVDDLRKAQSNPELYKDIIVRVWGVSLRFVDLEKSLQDEIIERFS